MTLYKLAPLKAAAIRFTKLDSCGAPSTATCAMFASKNLVMVEQSGETIDAAEFPLVNADGDLEEYQTDPPRLKYLKVDITVTKVVPELMPWLTGDAVITDDASSASSIGWKTQVNSASLANVAVELWTRLAGVSSCSGSAAYGYALYPWLVNGTMYEIKHENALSDLKISAITKVGSPWGTGPYSVNLSKATSTLNQPMGLFGAVSATDDHKIFQRTELAPPLASTACGVVVGTLAVVDDDAGGVGRAATATLPAGTGITPGYINWGDAGAPVAVVAGATTATHTYAATGTYTVTYRPSSQSGPVYTGSVTIA